MTEGDPDFLGHGGWRKRIHQLKQELRATASQQRLTIPEETKADGTEMKPKRIINSGKPTEPIGDGAAASPRRRTASPYSEASPPSLASVGDRKSETGPVGFRPPRRLGF